jgi:hypothetical protein
VLSLRSHVAGSLTLAQACSCGPGVREPDRLFAISF